MVQWFGLPVQFWALLLGWVFTLYLQRLSNRRTEALKRKDKLVDKVESLIEWVEDEIVKDGFSPDDAETCYTSLLTQIELRAHQFNTHVKQDVIGVELLGDLRRIDFFASTELDRYPFVVRDTAFEFIDHIEMQCNELYFGDGKLVQRGRRFFNAFIADWGGIAFALLNLILLVELFQLVFYFFNS